MISLDEMALWARVVMGAGYPASHLIPYLMTEFGLSYEAGYELALEANPGLYSTRRRE